MSESFTAQAFASVWGCMTAREQEQVRAKAKWEKVSISAALRWMYPALWSEVRAGGVR